MFSFVFYFTIFLFNSFNEAIIQAKRALKFLMFLEYIRSILKILE